MKPELPCWRLITMHSSQYADKLLHKWLNRCGQDLLRIHRRIFHIAERLEIEEALRVRCETTICVWPRHMVWYRGVQSSC